MGRRRVTLSRSRVDWGRWEVRARQGRRGCRGMGRRRHRSGVGVVEIPVNA